MSKVYIFDFWGVIYDPRSGRVMEGVEEFLKQLADQNIHCGVASSSSRKYIFDYLSENNLIQYFDVIIGADDVLVTKPDPGCYVAVAKHFRVQPGQCTVIDDSIAPIENAKKLGFNTVLFGVEVDSFSAITTV